MGCREAIFVDESTIDFPIFLLFFNTKFPIFPIFSILSFLFSYFFLNIHGARHPVQLNFHVRKLNWLFPSCPKPLFQSKVKYEAVDLKMIIFSFSRK